MADDGQIVNAAVTVPMKTTRLRPAPARKIGTGLAGPGRPKGLQNKMTGVLKDMIMTALTREGGVRYLRRQAKKNPTAFLTLVGKVLPLQVSGDLDQPLIPHTITFVVSKAPDSDNRT